MSTPQWQGRQYHYLSQDSHVHPFLVELWDEVRAATDGRLSITVHAKNEGLPGSHLAIVDLLIAGEVQFYALMGGILGPLVPAMEIQGLPFAFQDHAQVHATLDGPLGIYLRKELDTKGIHALPYGLLENGFRHISTVDRPIASAADLEGMRIRIPEGRMFADAFASMGAVPVEVNVADGNPSSGIHGVVLHRESGEIRLKRTRLGVVELQQPGQPTHELSLPRRGLRECLAEELRRLDPDDEFGAVLESGFRSSTAA